MFRCQQVHGNEASQRESHEKNGTTIRLNSFCDLLCRNIVCMCPSAIRSGFPFEQGVHDIVVLFVDGRCRGYSIIQQRMGKPSKDRLESLAASWVAVMVTLIFGAVFAVVPYLLFLSGVTSTILSETSSASSCQLFMFPNSLQRRRTKPSRAFCGILTFVRRKILPNKPSGPLLLDFQRGLC